MAVLAASICSRGGKPLLSRQFKELSKDKVTALLSKFPSLLSDSNSNQHTTVEEENVRYVYQPLEDFFVVLITNRQSNILQDIDTLHLFCQTISSILNNIDEREIFENCFEILNSFDEIIDLGYKENLTISQIITFLEMDSHEEKIQEIIERNKELEATEERKRKAKEIQRKEMLKKNMESNNYLLQQQSIIQPTYQEQPQIPSYDDYKNQIPSAENYANNNNNNSSNKPFGNAPPRRGGLQLGKKSNKSMFNNDPNQMDQDYDQAPLLINTPAPQRQSQQQQQQQQQYSQQQSHNTAAPASSSSSNTANKIANEGILIIVNEKFSGQISREGSIASSEIKGDLQLRINDPELALSKINLNLIKNPKLSTQFKTHPNVDKNLFNKESIIGLKDSTKPFPSNDQSLGVLRWKSVPKKDVSEEENVLLPLMLTTWVNNNNNGTINVTFEYELNETFTESKLLDEVSIIIPISNGTVESADNDNVSLKFVEEGLLVNLNKLTESPSGSFEIQCLEVEDDEALFPMEILFDITKQINGADITEEITLNEINIKNVVSTVDESVELPFDSYYIGNSESLYIV
ncbi:hypothetical protein B5S31_g1081 [[Candida] boidinii]|nr:hypothetical protein B5S31_g1081 [[Candida] boidinii]